MQRIYPETNSRLNYLNNIEGASGEGIGPSRKRNYISTGKKYIDDPNWKPMGDKVNTGIDELDKAFGDLFDDVKKIEKPEQIKVNMTESEKLKHQEQLNKDWEAFKADIKKNGIKEPIVVGYEKGSLKILEGNHRLTAANELGLTDIPIRYMDNVPKELKLK